MQGRSRGRKPKAPNTDTRLVQNKEAAVQKECSNVGKDKPVAKKSGSKRSKNAANDEVLHLVYTDQNVSPGSLNMIEERELHDLITETLQVEQDQPELKKRKSPESESHGEEASPCNRSKHSGRIRKVASWVKALKQQE